MHPAGKDSPNRSKRSPIRPGKAQDSKSTLQVKVLDPEADALRAQAEQIEHDVNHLSPALQRFWQVEISKKYCSRIGHNLILPLFSAS